MKRVGFDIGSTTIKCIVMDEKENILFKKYERHYSEIRNAVLKILSELKNIINNDKITVTISGSAGLGYAESLKIPFVQEVYAEKIAVNKYYPNTETVIELGGEDAKILFLTGGFEMRMNGSCAGGTGAFIDQMASLLNVTGEELNELSSHHEKICNIASRCGVFAKSDVQPLLNQGVRKEDIAAGIFRAVVNQTISGLSQGREIGNNVLYLGGPLYFYSELRNSFDEVLNTKGILPEDAIYFVAIGSVLANVKEETTLIKIENKFKKFKEQNNYIKSDALFKDKKEYEEFLKRHNDTSIKELEKPSKNMYLGIDAGSTTIKMVLCDDEGNIFNPFYSSNEGSLIEIVKKYLLDLYEKYPNINIKSCAVTGYGEELIKNAFNIDYGVVETIAHYTAAKKINPRVDFILDIGGQDIKCFKIKNGSIDSLYLNEACSSGCGSFLQTFAKALGYTTEEFSHLGLYAKSPVSLGSRCTVFMNSSVKQAQKDGASVESIAAGLSMSVVKNALYKVIRCANPKDLGENIIVQGGTFLNDSVLRAFEKEIGHNVTRPKYSGLMGAYGSALYSKEKNNDKSKILNFKELKNFNYETRNINCNGCTNHCNLVINTFDKKRRFIAGNRCSKPLNNGINQEHYDLYEYKQSLLKEFMNNDISENKTTIGIPLVLNMYELLPFWYTFFKSLGLNVIVSPFSTRNTYLKGQKTIPSDTICYPAKLVHGHIEYLIDSNVDYIFYPSMSYNFDEKLGTNHYNCPVVAYYPQVIRGNVNNLNKETFIDDFVSLADKKQFLKRIKTIIKYYGIEVTESKLKKAVDKSYEAYNNYLLKVRTKAEEFISIAEQKDMPIIVLCGRPYHVDPEVNHGINKLITSLGAVVITEDSISHKVKPFKTKVMNQWTYHSRLYAAAKYVSESNKNINLVQLVSFGCGVDAVTTDEVRRIIESKNKVYTQIKIDEISNMGAVTIRLRSLLAIIDNKNVKNK